MKSTPYKRRASVEATAATARTTARREAMRPHDAAWGRACSVSSTREPPSGAGPPGSHLDRCGGAVRGSPIARAGRGSMAPLPAASILALMDALRSRGLRRRVHVCLVPRAVLPFRLATRVWRNGRRAWFRSMWGQPREGSTPFTRTMNDQRLRPLGGEVVLSSVAVFFSPRRVLPARRWVHLCRAARSDRGGVSASPEAGWGIMADESNSGANAVWLHRLATSRDEGETQRAVMEAQIAGFQKTAYARTSPEDLAMRALVNAQCDALRTLFAARASAAEALLTSREAAKDFFQVAGRQAADTMPSRLAQVAETLLEAQASAAEALLAAQTVAPLSGLP